MTTTLPPTAAQTYLAEHEAELTATLAAVKATLSTTAAGMSRAELMADLLDKGVRTPAPSAAKAVWAEAWVAFKLGASDAQRALRDAQRAAAEDTMADGQVQALITGAEKLVQDFVAAVKPGDPAALGLLAYQVKWHGAAVAAAEVSTAFARQWLAARGKGVEPKDLAPRMAKDAIRRGLWASPTSMAPTGHGLTEAAVLEGSKSFLRAIGGVLPDDFPAFW